MRKLFVILSVALVSMISFTSCEKDKDKSDPVNSTNIIGTWESEDGEFMYTFNEDGTYVEDFYFEGTYEVVDGKIIFDGDEEFAVNGKIEGDKLTLTASFGGLFDFTQEYFKQ